MKYEEAILDGKTVNIVVKMPEEMIERNEKKEVEDDFVNTLDLSNLLEFENEK